MPDNDYETRLAAKRMEWIEQQKAEKLLREKRKAELLIKHAEERAARELEASEMKKQQRQLTELFSELLQELISRHILTLRKKYAQTVSRGDYGQWTGIDSWLKEIEIFSDAVVMSNAEVANVRTRALRLGFVEFFDVKTWLPSLIDAAIEASDIVEEAIDIEQMSGEVFEAHCFEILLSSGWSVVPKGGSGDQGVDLVGTLGKIRVAFQCKRYSQPVGNKAVQEVAAGRQYEQCDLAAVVTNATYTPAARQLASAINVMLLHYSELANLHEQILELFPVPISGVDDA
jgi:restriction system protein